MRPFPLPILSSSPRRKGFQLLAVTGLLLGFGVGVLPFAQAADKGEKRDPGRTFVGVQTQRKVFALTFDDGPDPQWTPQVLKVLKQRHVTATFFMVGEMVQDHPRFAKMVAAGGYPIGNHTWNHPSVTRNPEGEINRTDAILKKTLGVKPSLFRPPYGILDNGLAKVALAQKKDVIEWNDLGVDWDKHATAQSITTKVLRLAQPGGIVLLHDGGGNRSRTVAALPVIIDALRARGFQFVTVPELLTMGPALPFDPNDIVGMTHSKKSRARVPMLKKAKKSVQ